MSNHIAIDGEKAKPQTKALWRVFWILLIITSFEFIVAFGLDPDHFKWTKIGIFVVMTIVKAYYIVGTFMHLKDETKGLIATVVIPTVLVIWLLVALLMEGGYIYQAIYEIGSALAK